MVDLKDLKIKTGVAKRLLKELASYKKEVEKDEAKVASMRELGADPHDLKQQVRTLLCVTGFQHGYTSTNDADLHPHAQEAVLAESRMMVPDCQKRLENAFYDLESLVVSTSLNSF